MAHTRRSTARGLERVPRSAPVRVPDDEAASAAVRRVRRRERIRYKIFTLGLGLDMPMLFLILVLLSLGLVMLFSASYAYAYYYYGNSYYFVLRQGMFALLGVAAMMLISTFDYHHLHKFNILIFGISVVLLVMVLAFRDTSIAPVRNGANRWINIAGLEFQPSEIAKFALILMFAHFIALYGQKMNTFRYGFLPFAGILAIIAGLVFLESHVSATLIICLIAALMMFIGGTKLRYFVVIGIIGGVALACVLLFSDSFAYAMERHIRLAGPVQPAGGRRYLADRPVAVRDRLGPAARRRHRAVAAEVPVPAGSRRTTSSLRSSARSSASSARCSSSSCSRCSSGAASTSPCTRATASA